MTAFDVNALPCTPWKNGGGSTRTIAVSPPDAGFDDFDWRVSIADVASDGPFSRFPGIDRIILLLEGAGMNLQIDGRSIPLTMPFVPHKFNGDDEVDSRLINGASRDFNVMTRRGRAHADVRVFESDSIVPESDAALFFCARGIARINDTHLASGWAIRFDLPAQFTPQTSDTVLIAVLVTLEYS
jgi:environmental stress-induced protein Ves